MRAPSPFALAPAALAAAVLVAAGLASARQGSDRVVSLTLFAGTPAGLWRSSDWGGTWNRVVGRTSGASLDGIGSVRAIAPRSARGPRGR